MAAALRLLAPPCVRAMRALFRRLDPFVAAHRIGCVLFCPADIEFDARTLLQPDLFVAPLVDGREPRSWPEVLAERIEWRPSPGVPPLAIDLVELFAEILDT